MIPYSLTSIDHLNNFYNQVFKFMPDPSNFTVDDLKSQNPFLYDHYHRLHMMEQSYYIGVESHQNDLMVIAEQFRALNDKSKFFEFYGVNEGHFEGKEDYLEAQKTEFLNRVLTVFNMTNQILADIKIITSLFGWLGLPAKTEDIFTEDFLRTVNYQNMRLPKLIQAKTSAISNIADLKTEIELLNTQSLAMNSALGLKAGDIRTRSLFAVVLGLVSLIIMH